MGSKNRLTDSPAYSPTERGAVFSLYGVRVEGYPGAGAGGVARSVCPTPLPVVCRHVELLTRVFATQKAQLCTCPTPCPHIGKVGSDIMIPQKAGCKGFHLAVAPFSRCSSLNQHLGSLLLMLTLSNLHPRP